MDEVEVIQNYLLSHAGEETDVILGLGYDSTLGNKIGITLIATGFEHKSPFYSKAAVKEERKEEVKAEEKIVMTLQPAKEESKSSRPVVLMPEQRKEPVAEINEEPVTQKPAAPEKNPLMPSTVEP